MVLFLGSFVRSVSSRVASSCSAVVGSGVSGSNASSLICFASLFCIVCCFVRYCVMHSVHTRLDVLLKVVICITW